MKRAKTTLQGAINLLAERTHDNKKNLSEKDKQRRNQVVDLYGVDLSRNSKPSSLGGEETIFYVSVSSDLVYYERFQFKIYIEDSQANTFSLYCRANVETEDGEFEPQNINLTPYLVEQQDGEWINGDNGGNAWPNNSDVVDENADEPPNAYDILDVASVLYAEGKDNIADAILRPGFKKFILKGNGSFFGAMILYLKYSHLNR